MKMGGSNCKRRLLQQRSKPFIIQHWRAKQITDWLEILNRRPEGLPNSAQKRREAVLLSAQPSEKGKEGGEGRGEGGRGCTRAFRVRKSGLSFNFEVRRVPGLS